MRILFLTQVLPYPLDAGPKVRAYYVLRHLARTHEVTLVSFRRDTDTPEAVEHLAHFCREVHTLPMVRSAVRDALHLARSLVSRRPFIIARDQVPAMAGLLAGLIRQRAAMGEPFDALHADQLWMASYALAARQADEGRKPVLVLDQHNAVYLIPERLAQGEVNPLRRTLLRLEARKMARYEVETCRRFERVVWVTQQDYDAVQGRASAAHGPAFTVPRSAVIPICGDAHATPPVCRQSRARRVTFLGGLHYPPNAQGILWFAREAWPRIVSQVPDAVLTVIGKSPPVELADGRQGVPNCEVTGYVHDPRAYLEETAAFVVPLLAGGGMRVKIVDAWLWGLPIVTTTIGAEGIETKPGENLLIADDPEEMAAAVVRLLSDSAAAEQLARSGRAWGEQHYDWRTVYHKWDAVYAEPG